MRPKSLGYLTRLLIARDLGLLMRTDHELSNPSILN